MQLGSVRPDTAEVVPLLRRLTEEGTGSTFREVTPQQLFGTHSEQAVIPLGEPAPLAPTATSGYGVLLLALVATYAILIYRHAGDIRQLLGRLLQDRSSDDRLYEDSGSSFSRFLNLCNLFGLVVAGAVIVRVTAQHLPAEHLLRLPHTAALLWSLAVVAALSVAALYRLGISALIGAVTYTKPLFEQLYLIKRTFVALLTIVTLPPLALWLPLSAGEGSLWWWIIVGMSVLLLVLYLHETRQLFLSKKISILHWFLYLCAVEIFPLSLLWLLAVRFL